MAAAEVVLFGMPVIIAFPRGGETCIVKFEPFFNTMTIDSSSPGYSFAMRSIVGSVRSGNEDYCAASPEKGIFIVCDGMGGAAAGEVASQLAATTFVRHMENALPIPDTAEPLLDAAVKAANAAVIERAAESTRTRGMGTTLVALLVEEDGRKLWLTHVGDSRCYRMRAGELTPMTRDHSLVQEQMTAGQMTAEQAERSPMKNIITRAIGSNAVVEPEIQLLAPEVGDVYLLSSDGLTRELSDAELTAHLAGEDLEAMAGALVDAANAAGGHDNITVLLLKIGTERG
ncbi:MAG: Stp1/IreP family PP2C-type Ser/Thr phosphatase [Granulicella sp.]